MKTFFTLLFISISAALSAQTTYNVPVDVTWTGGSAFPNPCYNCTFNVANGVTITLDADVTLQNSTVNGGRVVVNPGRKITLWTSGGLKNNFTNTQVEFKTGAGITASAPLNISNSTWNFLGTSSMTTQQDFTLTNSTINFKGNSSYSGTGGPIDLKSNSHIVVGDGASSSAAFMFVNGPVVNIYDNASSIDLMNQYNYYFNWNTYNSISNNTTYTTTNNNMNCGAGKPVACDAPKLYGPVRMNYAGFSNPILLPVVLSDYNVISTTNNTVSINWTTQQEKSAAYFEIQRSANGSDWSVIGNQSAKGNSTISEHYNFNDASPLKGVGYYRLRMVDVDSKFSYSVVKAVRIDANNDVKVFPNPATDFVSVSFEKSGTGNKVQLLNQFGQVITEKTASSNTVLTFSLSQYANGSYIIKVTNASGSEKSVKLLVNHK